MAKNDSKAASTTTSLATTKDEGGALAAPAVAGDLMASLGLADAELPETGLGQYDNSDLRIPAIVFNAGGLDDQQREIPKTTFLHTVARTTKPKLRLAVIGVHKSRAWATFDAGTGKTDVHCESWDLKQGVMAEGQRRPCGEACPDYRWTKDDKTGKPHRNCADVDNVAVVDRESGELTMMRFKKTSLRPWRDHLQKFFLRKRPLGGGRPNADYPGFVFETTVKLEMVKEARVPYARPVFDVARDEAGKPILLPADEVRAYAQFAIDMRGQLADMRASAKVADQVAGDADADVIDTSFDMSDDDAPPAPAKGGGQATFPHE